MITATGERPALPGVCRRTLRRLRYRLGRQTLTCSVGLP
jgi:hypothetical protein